jgi:hypothetical protein
MYTILDTKKTTELFLLRTGWFTPEYELKDDTDSYGKITYYRLSGCRATAMTANVTWTFQHETFFSSTILITDQNGVTIGKAYRELFSRRTTLSLETGFRADFYRPSIWRRKYIWESEAYGKILHIKNNLFSLRDTIYIDQSMTPPALIPLLVFFGSYLVILCRRRRTKH